MKTDQLLNTLILSLSVSTILITLMSYLIFKIRQFSVRKNLSPEQKREGIFFRRYVPSDPKLPAKDRRETPVVEARSRLLLFFGLVLAIVFGTLLSKDYVASKFARYERWVDAKEIKRLRGAGLYRSYHLETTAEAPALSELIGPVDRSLHAEKLRLLRGKRIGLIHWDAGGKNPHVALSMRNWTRFLTRAKIPFEVLSEKTLPRSFDAYVLPQARSISDAQIAELSRLMDMKKGLLVTGPSGVFDGRQRLRSPAWIEQRFKLKVAHRGSRPLRKPSRFRGPKDAPLSLVPGLLLDWFPLDEAYGYLSDSPDAFVLESEFSGFRPGSVAGSSIRGLPAVGNERLVWSALDPRDVDADSAEAFYSEFLILELLATVTRLPSVTVELWKHGRAWSFALTSDAEEKIEGSYRIWELLKDLRIPGTFFVVTDKLQEDDRLVREDSALLELGSHTKSHETLSAQDLQSQFDEMQSSRLTLEKRSGKHVRGFHPPAEKFNDETLEAAVQNRFSYFFGDQRLYRYAPALLRNGLVYFPRVFSDDFVVQRNADLLSDDDLVAFLRAESEEARQARGLQILNLHSQVLGQAPYLDAVEAYLRELTQDPDVWIAPLGEIQDWWRQRAALIIELSQTHVRIRNTGPSRVEGLVVRIHRRRVPVTVNPGATVRLELAQ